MGKVATNSFAIYMCMRLLLSFLTSNTIPKILNQSTNYLGNTKALIEIELSLAFVLYSYVNLCYLYKHRRIVIIMCISKCTGSNFGTKKNVIAKPAITRDICENISCLILFTKSIHTIVNFDTFGAVYKKMYRTPYENSD